LLDVKGRTTSEAARHAFTRAHRRLFIVAILTAVPILLWASLHMASVVIRNGLLMSAAVAAYFLIVHAAPLRLRRLWPKELAVGVIFALGTSLVVWSRMTPGEQSELIGPALLFAALCWLNCVAIEHWECRRFQLSEPHPWTRWMGCHILKASGTIALASLMLASLGPSRPMMAAAALSASGLLWLEWRNRSFSLNALRVMADAVLLSPALLLLFPL
jgi:hypothetical protein